MKCSKRNAAKHDYSFNFWIGCHRMSEGCKKCYMFLAQGGRPWSNPNEVKLCTSTWGNPRT
jgi:protein gp37